MIISRLDFLERTGLEHETLQVWIAEEWLIPAKMSDEMMFSDVDVARATLIEDLLEDLGVNEQGVGVILNLLDQIHGLRIALAETLKALGERSSPG